MPSPAFRPDILKLLGWENWDPLRDAAMAELARRREIWAQNAEARAASIAQGGLCTWNGSVNAKFNMDDEKDLGLRKLYANQDEGDEARSSDSSEDSDSSMDDDEDEDQESEDSDEDEDDEGSEDAGDGDDDDDDEHEEDFSKEDDGVDKKTQLRK